MCTFPVLGSYASKLRIGNGGYWKRLFHTFKCMCSSTCNRWKLQWTQALCIIAVSSVSIVHFSKKDLHDAVHLIESIIFRLFSRILVHVPQPLDIDWNFCNSVGKSTFLQLHPDITCSRYEQCPRSKPPFGETMLNTSPRCLCMEPRLPPFLKPIYRHSRSDLFYGVETAFLIPRRYELSVSKHLLSKRKLSKWSLSCTLRVFQTFSQLW